MNQTPEEVARDKIDRHLEASGWTIQDKKHIDLSAGDGIAVREYYTDIGPADYILFVDRKPVGVIEAKKEEEGVRLTIHEEQSSEYAKSKLKHLNNEPLPFVYESTGALTRFTDYGDPKPRSRPAFTFHRPETFREWSKKPKFLRDRLLDLPDLPVQGFPLPPLPEQNRIVAKIEELFSELEKGVEALKTAQQQLKVYRQAVLKWAFEGKLTEEWRSQQKNLPTASQLLEQIKAEREKLARATGKKLKPTAPLTKEELDELPTLPGGWGWVRMSAISDACLGKMLDADKNKGTPKPYLRNSNVRWGAFDLSDLQEMKFEDDEDERYGVKKGDLIVCEGGEPGRAAIWNAQIPDMKIQKALHRVRFSEFALSKYVLFFLVLSSRNGHLDKYFTGTTIKHLPGEKLAIFTLPLCSVDEQLRTVAEIESRLSVAEKIEETLTQSLKQAEALRQSILKKAFEGKLVPQDPNDEPAEKLLARIRAEKGAQMPVKGRRKGRQMAIIAT